MSTSRKIAEWTFTRTGNLPDMKATVFMNSPQSNSEHEDPFTFHAQVEGKRGAVGPVEDLNELNRLLQVTANPKAGMEWEPVYFVGIHHRFDREKAQRPEDDEPGNWNRNSSTSACLDISYRTGWMATKGKTRYFCARDPRVAMHLKSFEITSSMKELLGHEYHDATVQIYPATDANRDALDNLVSKLEALSKSLDALNVSKDLTQLSGLLPLAEK
jgi:hypothetical protein